jgi:hypothetical protein
LPSAGATLVLVLLLILLLLLVLLQLLLTTLLLQTLPSAAATLTPEAPAPPKIPALVGPAASVALAHPPSPFETLPTAPAASPVPAAPAPTTASAAAVSTLLQELLVLLLVAWADEGALLLGGLSCVIQHNVVYLVVPAVV